MDDLEKTIQGGKEPSSKQKVEWIEGILRLSFHHAFVRWTEEIKIKNKRGMRKGNSLLRNTSERIKAKVHLS